MITTGVRVPLHPEELHDLPVVKELAGQAKTTRRPTLGTIPVPRAMITSSRGRKKTSDHRSTIFGHITLSTFFCVRRKWISRMGLSHLDRRCVGLWFPLRAIHLTPGWCVSSLESGAL